MLKCGITGSSGNLGKNFLITNKHFRYIKFKGDISNKEDVYYWIKNNEFDILIHFAALVPTSKVNSNYKKALITNVHGTKYLVDAILKFKKNINWIFFSSTSHIYPFQKKKIKETFKPDPASKYGKTKLVAENYFRKKLEKANINFCVGRIFSIFDNEGDDFLIPNLTRIFKKKQKNLVLENLNHYRDFLSTKQISKVILFLWKKKYVGTINIGSGVKTNLKSIAKIFANKAKKKVSFKFNKPTFHLADISKLRKLGYKQSKLNIEGFFN